MDLKTGGDYASLLRGIGQIILYNAYLANALVKETQDKNIIKDLSYPGVLFFNPFAVFFETRFNWSYLQALTASNPKINNLSKLQPEEFPETIIFSSNYASSTAEESVENEDAQEFNNEYGARI